MKPNMSSGLGWLNCSYCKKAFDPRGEGMLTPGVCPTCIPPVDKTPEEKASSENIQHTPAYLTKLLDNCEDELSAALAENERLKAEYKSLVSHSVDQGNDAHKEIARLQKRVEELRKENHKLRNPPYKTYGDQPRKQVGE